MTPSPATLRALLLDAATNHPEDPGIHWTQPDGTQHSLAESERLSRARVIAEIASRLDLSPGDRAAVLVSGDPARTDLLFGLTSVGVVVVQLDPNSPSAEITRQIRESGASVVFADAPSPALAAELPGVRFIARAGVPYPSAPSAQTGNPEDYPSLFTEAIVPALSSGATFDRFSPEPHSPALWRDGTMHTHAQLVESKASNPP